MVWAQILVIILSVLLALFLILAIALTVILIKLTRQIKNVTSVAERAATKFEAVASNVAMATSPIALVKLAKSLFGKPKKKGESHVKR